MGSALSASEVGVISPYYKQTSKLRLLLKQRGLGAVRVMKMKMMLMLRC